MAARGAADVLSTQPNGEPFPIRLFAPLVHRSWTERIERGNQGDDCGVDSRQISLDGGGCHLGQRYVVPESALNVVRTPPDDHERVANDMVEIGEGRGTRRWRS